MKISIEKIRTFDRSGGEEQSKRWNVQRNGLVHAPESFVLKGQLSLPEGTVDLKQSLAFGFRKQASARSIVDREVCRNPPLALS